MMFASQPKTILILVGTRPEAIKMAPILLELKRSNSLKSILCSTGQHRQILDQSLELFGIKPELDLNVMSTNHTLASLTTRLFSALDPILTDLKPSAIVAQGDTTSVFVSSVLAFYHKIPFFHVEAGLRTHDLNSPFPEEFNRRVADLVAALHFAPTGHARSLLLSEGIPSEKILVTGNTIVDALLEISKNSEKEIPGLTLKKDKKLVLVTVHRRENFGAPLDSIFLAIKNSAQALSEIEFVIPVHPNPNVREKIHTSLRNLQNVHLLDPLPYDGLIHVMKKANLILTDSGGIQEEAPSFGVPLYVLRTTTERPEGVAAGVAKLIGIEQKIIETHISDFFSDPSIAAKMKVSKNPYGDGTAAKQIVDAMERFFEPCSDKLETSKTLNASSASNGGN